MIPVLKYSHKRTKDLIKKNIKTGYVSLDILNKDQIISTRNVIFRILQTQKIEDKLKPINCEFYLYDESSKEIISDKKIQLFDSHEENPEQRIFKINLTLKPNVVNKIYYLKIIDLYQEKELLSLPINIKLGIGIDDFEGVL